MRGMGMPARGRGLAILGMSVAAGLLGGCSDRMLDTGLTNYLFAEPRVEQPTPIRSMTGEVTSYPNLGTVPARPKNLSTQAQRDKEMQRLAEERARNRSAADALEGRAQSLPAPLPQPMDVPPPPRIREGG